MACFEITGLDDLAVQESFDRSLQSGHRVVFVSNEANHLVADVRLHIPAIAKPLSWSATGRWCDKLLVARVAMSAIVYTTCHNHPAKAISSGNLHRLSLPDCRLRPSK